MKTILSFLYAIFAVGFVVLCGYCTWYLFELGFYLWCFIFTLAVIIVAFRMIIEALEKRK